MYVPLLMNVGEGKGVPYLWGKDWQSEVVLNYCSDVVARNEVSRIVFSPIISLQKKQKNYDFPGIQMTSQLFP